MTTFESLARDAQPLMTGRNMKEATRRKSRPPSRASLREMPEVDFTLAKTRRNPYSHRVVIEGASVHIVRGRPKKGSETGPTSPRSIRFPDEVWQQTLEKRAKAEGITWVEGSVPSR